jgi:hypothetical protein
MSNAMESFLMGLVCVLIVAYVLFGGAWAALNDPAFDPDRQPHSPTNMGKAWVPE